jgi:hypothetical protein
MSARYGVFLLASCNRLFGLGDVGEREANVRKFDAPVDAAPQCPPLGMAPTFRPAAHSLPFASCSNYPISESHMSTDGDVLARAAHYSGQPSTFGVELQHRDAPFRWSNAGTLPYQIDEETPPIVSNLTAGPEPHILWIEITTTGNNLREFAKRGGSWQQVDIYDFTTVAGYLVLSRRTACAWCSTAATGSATPTVRRSPIDFGRRR